MPGREIKFEVIDPEHVRETLVSGGVLTHRYASGLVQLNFLFFRDDAQAPANGQERKLPSVAVVGRVILPDEAALDLAEQLGKVVDLSKTLGAHMFPDQGSGRPL